MSWRRSPASRAPREAWACWSPPRARRAESRCSRTTCTWTSPRPRSSTWRTCARGEARSPAPPGRACRSSSRARTGRWPGARSPYTDRCRTCSRRRSIRRSRCATSAAGTGARPACATRRSRFAAARRSRSTWSRPSTGRSCAACGRTIRARAPSRCAGPAPASTVAWTACSSCSAAATGSASAARCARCTRRWRPSSTPTRRARSARSSPATCRSGRSTPRSCPCPAPRASTTGAG